MDTRGLDLQILAELASLRRVVEGLTTDVRALAGARRTDEANVIELLSTVSRALGNAPWAVSALFDLALDTAPGAQDLLTAIVAIVGEPQAGSPQKRLGIFLAQHVGVTGNWRLDSVRGRTRTGKLWVVTVAHQLSRKKFSDGVSCAGGPGELNVENRNVVQK